jgi:SAM-dependent methyltransferase
MESAMDDYIAITYGEQLADVYDLWFSSYEEAAIDLLAQLARGGRALELGIGTGRVAIPLAARGVEVHGIDGSEAMVSRLRARPGGEKISVTMGNFAHVNVDGKFSLVFTVFNTFFALLAQEEQVRCFSNVAKHLEPGGAFVLEVFVPDMTHFDQGQSVRATAVTTDRVSLKVSQLDKVNQRMKSQHIVFADGEIKLFPVEVRYAWPSELDLMARITGLRLRHRWSGWNREEFTSTSEKHISVYERPA